MLSIGASWYDPQAKQVLHNEEVLGAPVRLEQRLEQEPKLPNNIPEKYALIINGDGALDLKTSELSRFQKNVNRTYHQLRNLGFDPEFIYVLEDVGVTNGISYPVDDHASMASLRMISNALTDRLDEKDQLLVYATDHGLRLQRQITFENRVQLLPPQSVLVLSHEYVGAWEFAHMLSQVRTHASIFVFGQCYGGGFVDAMIATAHQHQQNVVALSSSSPQEEAWGWVFDKPFFEAFGDSLADKNKDHHVDIHEAFDHADELVAMDRYTTTYITQHPYLRFTIDPSVVSLQ